MATSDRYRFLTMATTIEERPYLVAAVHCYYTGMTMSGFLRKCVEAELAKKAAEKKMTIKELLFTAIAAENNKPIEPVPAET